MFDVRARSLLSGQTTGPLPKEFAGRIHNLSNGGVCILSSLPLQASMFVCCSFPASDVPVAIPTLMQVRWTAKRGNKAKSYISGLQFVV